MASYSVHIKDPVEVLYLALMLRWEQSSPPDRHQGLLDGKEERNTQISRMAYLLSKIAAGNTRHTFQTLARYSRRNDGQSYISKDYRWMKEPYPLLDGWFYEGCMNLPDKIKMLQHLEKLGLSSLFILCAGDFITGISVEKYMPTYDEQEAIIREIEGKELSIAH